MSKYDPLSAYLDSPGPSFRRMNFARIEEVLGFSLPPSAYLHGPWWANDLTHSQARAWLSVGWETGDLDRVGKKVTFRRVS